LKKKLLTLALATVITVLSIGVYTSPKVTLHFVMWSYGVEIVQDNIRKFMEMYPDIEVIQETFSWFKYHDIIVSRFTTGVKTEVLYASDHWLQEWAEAGWLVPIEDYYPEIAEYKDDMPRYVIEGMTYEGKLYGLPYYADLMIFMYNDVMLKEAGYEKPPETWDEFVQMCLTMKEKGLSEYPFILMLKADEPQAIEAFFAIAYSFGGRFFDENLNPIFNQPDNGVYKALEFLAKAYQEWKILDPASFESGDIAVTKAMASGRHFATVIMKYDLAEVNNPEVSELAKKYTKPFKMALMPGTHETVGFVRFYAMSRDAVEGGKEVMDAAWKFIEYMGGKTDGEYKVVKRWALERGLGFGILSLYDDPDVREAINKWGDVDLEKQQAQLARAKEGMTPWFGEWDIYARIQIQKAVLGELSVKEALDNMAEKWLELKSEYE